MRVTDQVGTALRDIRRQPVRTVLTVGALTISTVILVSLLAIGLGARKTVLDQLALNSSPESVIVTPNQNVGLSILGGNVQLAREGSGKLDDDAVRRVGRIPHVTAAFPMVGVWELKTFTIEGTGKSFVAQANGVAETGPDVVELSAGAPFTDSDKGHDVVLGYSFAKELGYADRPELLIGKTMIFTTVDGYRGEGAAIPRPGSTRDDIDRFTKTSTRLTATVTAISKSGVRANQLLLPMGWVRQIKTVQSYSASGALEKNDQLAKNGYSSIILTAGEKSHIRSITQAVQAAGYGYVSAQQQIDRITSLTTIVWGVLGAVVAVSLITAGLGIANTMFTTIAEQRYAIGVWRALGARRRTIAARFLVHSGLLGIVGGLLGTAAGWAVGHYTNRGIREALAAEGLPVFDVIVITPELAALSIVVTTTFGMLSGLYPAWRAARQDPSASLASR